MHEMHEYVAEFNAVFGYVLNSLDHEGKQCHEDDCAEFDGFAYVWVCENLKILNILYIAWNNTVMGQR